MVASKPNLKHVETSNDHEPIDSTRVALHFKSIPNGGAKLTLHHEGYSRNSEAGKIRNEHVEGWAFFLEKLQEQR